MRHAAVWLWAAVALSLMSWYTAGYPWRICALAVLLLLAPLRGLVRGHRYTYAWATLFAVPYLIFAVTELLVNPQGALGRCAQPVTGIRVVLRYGFVSACFSRASRMKGIVRRRWAAREASSSSSSRLRSEGRSRGTRFIR